MTSSPPTLVGFNNNVRYRGMRFHIQTEDSGITRPHIITHLFADGGYVIKSLRTDYAEIVNHPERAVMVHRMMRDQHRAMALDLRDGRLDATIDRLPPPLPADEGSSPHASRAPLAEPAPGVSAAAGSDSNSGSSVDARAPGDAGVGHAGSAGDGPSTSCEAVLQPQATGPESGAAAAEPPSQTALDAPLQQAAPNQQGGGGSTLRPAVTGFATTQRPADVGGAPGARTPHGDPREAPPSSQHPASTQRSGLSQYPAAGVGAGSTSAGSDARGAGNEEALTPRQRRTAQAEQGRDDGRGEQRRVEEGRNGRAEQAQLRQNKGVSAERGAPRRPPSAQRPSVSSNFTSAPTPPEYRLGQAATEPRARAGAGNAGGNGSGSASGNGSGRGKAPAAPPPSSSRSGSARAANTNAERVASSRRTTGTQAATNDAGSDRRASSRRPASGSGGSSASSQRPASSRSAAASSKSNGSSHQSASNAEASQRTGGAASSAPPPTRNSANLPPHESGRASATQRPASSQRAASTSATGVRATSSRPPSSRNGGSTQRPASSRSGSSRANGAARDPRTSTLTGEWTASPASIAPPPSSASGAARRAGRPSAALPNKPSGSSIFGPLPQDSLDDAILTYVSKAKNDPPSRGSK
jgi:hypothetical protein